VKRTLIGFVGGLLAFALIGAAAWYYDGQETPYWEVSWTANASGAAYADTKELQGYEITGFATNPGDGATSPTDNYDVTLIDGWSLDLLQGQGANRDQSANEGVWLTVASICPTTASLRIASAGAVGTGQVRIYFRKVAR
jgi:hypothetical protein